MAFINTKFRSNSNSILAWRGRQRLTWSVYCFPGMTDYQLRPYHRRAAEELAKKLGLEISFSYEVLEDSNIVRFPVFSNN